MSDVVLLLSGRTEDRVAALIEAATEHRVVGTDPDALETATFDICIFDEAALAAHEDALRSCSEGVDPVFLPLLLVLPEARWEELAGLETPSLPPGFDIVDDIVVLPAPKPVFTRRIESLLRIHEQSVELGNSERRYRALVEQSLSGVFVSAGGVFEFVNDRVAELVGMDPTAMLGRSTTALAASVDQDRLAADVRRFESGDTDTIRGTYEGERADGSTVHFVLEATRVDLVSGAVALGVVVDITEQVTAERRAASRAEQLSLLNRIVRHDIRNDLNVLLGWGETLQDHVDAEGRPALERVLRTARHIQDLTYAVGDIAQLVEAEGEVVIEPTDAAAVLRQEVEMVEAQYAASDHTVTVDGVAALPPRVVVRANEMLSSVFGNLLSNAVLHARSDAVSIQVGIDVGEDVATVTIADDGPGIPDGAKERIFGRGERGLESSGSGLGLYLVDRLVEEYGGAVRIDDVVPHGARFVVELPLASGEELDHREEHEDAEDVTDVGDDGDDDVVGI